MKIGTPTTKQRNGSYLPEEVVLVIYNCSQFIKIIHLFLESFYKFVYLQPSICANTYNTNWKTKFEETKWGLTPTKELFCQRK